MHDACAAVGVQPPARTKPGEWVRCVTFPCDAINETVQNANTPRDCGPQRVLTSPTCKEVEMAKTRVCTIDGCCKPVVARGWCDSHYRRWKRNGSPIGGGTPPRAALDFLKYAASYQSDECLVWPFSRTACGYARIFYHGLNTRASRVVCELVHGAPPTECYEAAHSCGNGHLGCVNPKHLSWKTSAENKADQIMHGTRQALGSHWNAKLSEGDVREIIESRSCTPQAELAERFGVAVSTVSRIQTGKRWRR